MSVFGVILARIFPHSDSIRRDTPYLSIFSRNAGKYGPEYLQIWTLFKQCYLLCLTLRPDFYASLSFGTGVIRIQSPIQISVKHGPSIKILHGWELLTIRKKLHLGCLTGMCISSISGNTKICFRKKKLSNQNENLNEN